MKAGKRECIVLKTMRNRKLGSSEQGSEIVEFSLVVVVLCTLIFGIIDFSRAMYAYHWTAYAAREATRYASVHGSSFPTTCATYSSSGCQTTAAIVASYVQTLAPGVYISNSRTAYSSGSHLGAGDLTVITTYPGTNGTPASCSIASGTNSPGCPVNVSVQYVYGFSLKFLSSLSNLTMSSTAQVMISQ